MYKNHCCHASRMRAHAVLMSDAGFSLKELTATFGICRQTASTWLHSWDELGICGLLDAQRSGRPTRLSAKNKRQAIELVKEFTRNLKTVLARLYELTGINLIRSSLKRLCKPAKLCWKRVRKSLKSKRDPELFAQFQQQLLALQRHNKSIWSCR
jgi:transposase